MAALDERIDGGKPFNWGRVSAEYAEYRDIYPREFYQRIADRGLCVKGQRILDVGTGTGVLPRNMHAYGGKWIGADISEEQISQARRLSGGMDIEYRVVSAEELDFPVGTFDVITACQCFWYFRHERVAPLFHKALKPSGKLVVLYMAWLPFEDEIAGASESLVLKYHPQWSGAGESIHPIDIPDSYREGFELTYHEEYRLGIPFTRGSWHGRMKACRGVGASLSAGELKSWDREHRELLLEIAPERFDILHYAAFAELTRR
ncbi:MAG: methyltransferase domain-containing protein [Coriobacteriia bacterium]|nr:methyltransferase domain-containing protein [Coriobacteriia bacterium]